MSENPLKTIVENGRLFKYYESAGILLVYWKLEEQNFEFQFTANNFELLKCSNLPDDYWENRILSNNRELKKRMVPLINKVMEQLVEGL